MADETTEAQPAPEKTPEEEMREKTAKYGVGYAIMSDAFKGEGITMVTRLVSWFLVAAAVGVVLLAVASKLL